MNEKTVNVELNEHELNWIKEKTDQEWAAAMVTPLNNKAKCALKQLNAPQIGDKVAGWHIKGYEVFGIYQGKTNDNKAHIIQVSDSVNTHVFYCGNCARIKREAEF